MKVVALKDGTIGKDSAVRRVRAGDVFDLPDDHRLGKWMQVVAERAPVAKAAAKPSGKVPKTLSEISKQSTEPPKGDEDLV